jgi:CheY-like chemotaxis protein
VSFPSFPILLVDDEPAWLRSLRVALGRAGIDNVLTCQDARQVMDLLAREPVGLVLLDLNMPHLGGEDLLARIAAERPEVAVIVISGMNQVDTAVRCGLPFLAVVGNDARWNAEYQIQLRDYGAQRLVGCELLPTRYDEVARAFGGFGALVSEPVGLEAALQQALQSGLPACLNRRASAMTSGSSTTQLQALCSILWASSRWILPGFRCGRRGRCWRMPLCARQSAAR